MPCSTVLLHLNMCASNLHGLYARFFAQVQADCYYGSPWVMGLNPPPHPQTPGTPEPVPLQTR